MLSYLPATLPWQRSRAPRRWQLSPCLYMTRPMSQRRRGPPQRVRGPPSPGSPGCQRMARGPLRSMTSPGSGTRNRFPKPLQVSPWLGRVGLLGPLNSSPGPGEGKEWTPGVGGGPAAGLQGSTVERITEIGELGSVGAALCAGSGNGHRRMKGLPASPPLRGQEA